MKCIRCGAEFYDNKRICNSCMREWAEMRELVYTTLIKLHGGFNYTNDSIFKKEFKRLEKLWRKDRDKFQAELESINPHRIKN